MFYAGEAVEVTRSGTLNGAPLTPDQVVAVTVDIEDSSLQLVVRDEAMAYDADRALWVFDWDTVGRASGTYRSRITVAAIDGAFTWTFGRIRLRPNVAGFAGDVLPVPPVDLTVLHRAGTETVSGDKDFTGELTKDGHPVAAAASSPSGEFWRDDGTWAVPGGGGAGSPVIRKFPFAFNTPGLLTGHAVYTPTIGDILLDAWIEIDTAWDGTTPKGDIGTFFGGNVFGWWSATGNPVDMTQFNTVDSYTDTLLGSHGEGGTPPSRLSLAWIAGEAAFGFLARELPAKFVAANPIKVVVSQNGTTIGANPGSTQGAAILYLATATPVG